jgi:HlyD family secretion protein
MSARNRFFSFLGIIFVMAAIYYFFSTNHSKDLVLIGTVDSNQVIVSAQVEGRIQKLLVDEGTPVKAGDLIAVLDSSELQTQEAAATANIASVQHKVSEMQHTEKSTSGSTSSDVANARAMLSSAKAQLLQAKAALDRTESDSRRMIELAKAGVQSEQDRVQAETNLQAAQATVQAQQELVKAAEANLNSAIARTQQANAAKSTVQSTEADLNNAIAQKNQAAVRLGYTNVYAPVSGTVSVRAARQGEVVNIGAPIVTIVDLTDTWARAAIPETYADHIGYGDVLRVRLPGGTITSGKVFFKGVEGDFATQRDVGRMKRDIRTIVLKVRLDNPKGAFVPGMTAEVLVSPEQLKGREQSAERGGSGAAMMADLNAKANGGDFSCAWRRNSPTPSRSSTSSRSTATSPPSTMFRST